MDSDPEVQAFLGNVKKYTLQERIQFLESEVHKTAVGPGGQLSVMRKDDSITIGFVKLKINETGSVATLSYMFGKEFWGKGYCNEACSEILRIGFMQLGLSKICADTAPDNKRSMNVLMGLAMIPDVIDLRSSCNAGDGTGTHFIRYYITKQSFEEEIISKT
jgi:ribosomal-protein-alanine N-acetyltransferase